MTPTEIIATKLLGWERTAITHNLNPGFSRFERIVDDRRQSAFVDIETGMAPARAGHLSKWPDFTTLDGCAEFESALIERRLWLLYLSALTNLSMKEEPLPRGEDYAPMKEVEIIAALSSLCILRAKPAQRVTSCLKVIEQAKL